MSSNILNTIKNLRKNLHNVGNLNNWGKKVLNQGAKVVDSDIDNFELVELGFNAEGERTCKRITTTATKGHLVATPEDYMKEYETISAFFNAQDEMARVVMLDSGVRFECSNVEFEADVNAHALKNGQLVYYKHDTRKFRICNQSPQGDGGYNGATNKFYLVDKDCVSVDGQAVYRFEVQ